MDIEQLEKLERLAEQTTQESWICWYREKFIGISAQNRDIPMKVADAEYITALVNAAPDLIKRARELEQQNKELSEWNYEFQREVRKLQFQLEQAQKEAE